MIWLQFDDSIWSENYDCDFTMKKCYFLFTEKSRIQIEIDFYEWRKSMPE